MRPLLEKKIGRKNYEICLRAPIAESRKDEMCEMQRAIFNPLAKHQKNTKKTSSRTSWPFLWSNRAKRPKKCQKKDHRTPISNLGRPIMRGKFSRTSWPFLWSNRAKRPKMCQKNDHITPISNLGRQIMRGTSSRNSWPFLW